MLTCACSTYNVRPFELPLQQDILDRHDSEASCDTCFRQYVRCSYAELSAGCPLISYTLHTFRLVCDHYAFPSNHVVMHNASIQRCMTPIVLIDVLRPSMQSLTNGKCMSMVDRSRVPRFLTPS